jgi:uncharacterized protein YciI
MTRSLSKCIAVSITALLFVSYGFGQAKPEYDMGKMQMVFLKQVPEWKPKKDSQVKKVKQEQSRYVEGLIKEGKCALAGPVKGAGDLREVLVFKTESLEEVQELTKSFPAVKSGMLKAEVLSWFAARNVILAPESPITASNYVFGLLVRGSKWTPGQTPETNKIQEGHLANINRLAEAGKLVLAGPFYDEGERRGVFIFKVDSLDEAQKLTNTDPAVIAGRLKIELYRWSIPKGVLK